MNKIEIETKAISSVNSSPHKNTHHIKISSHMSVENFLVYLNNNLLLFFFCILYLNDIKSLFVLV